ncbi:MAG TPA: HigA family addiction module antitoxin [Acidobacteriaceae bacterium]|nr:HigA family addiction module antitoxin [Acidobacteriaceae bacterium]
MRKQRSPFGDGTSIPGEILREVYMKPLGLRVYALAKELKLTRPRLNDIVLERRAITADTAVRLARYFGMTAQFWMNMRSSYELREAENANREIVESILPRGWDAGCGDPKQPRLRCEMWGTRP